jgi:hypothetical protein
MKKKIDHIGGMMVCSLLIFEQYIGSLLSLSFNFVVLMCVLQGEVNKIKTEAKHIIEEPYR